MKTVNDLRVGDLVWRTWDLADWAQPESSKVIDIDSTGDGWTKFTIDYPNWDHKPTVIRVRDYQMKRSHLTPGCSLWFLSEEGAADHMIDNYETNISQEYQEIGERLKRIEGMQKTYNRLRLKYGSHGI